MINLKNFIDRNKPIFLVGAATLLIFFGIIVFNQKRNPGETKLRNVKEETEIYIVETEKNKAGEDIIETLEELDAYIEEHAEEIYDSTMGVFVIEFTENGFQPKNSRALQGQLLRFVNKTTKDIYIKQRISGYDELKEPVKIEAGGTFTLRLLKDILWGFEETTTKSVGSLYIFKPEF
jgi:hypothetical protein